MGIGDKIKVGYAQDWMGQATRKYQIVAETISGEYVCCGMPEVIERLDGSAGRANSRYIGNPATGLFLRDKSEFTDIKEEIIGG